MVAEPKRLTIAQIKGKDTRTVHVVDWPGLPGKRVGIMELRCGEQLDAYFAAREVFTRRGWHVIDQAAQPHFNAELELQYCYRMLIDPDAAVPSARVFKDVDEARSRLDPDERGHFTALHVVYENEKVGAWQPKPPEDHANDDQSEQNEQGEAAQ